MADIKKRYLDFSVILTNFIVLLLVVNLACAAGIGVAYLIDVSRHAGWIPRTGPRWIREEDVAKLYPGWSAADVRTLEHDTLEAVGIQARTYDEITQLRPLPLHTRFVNIRDPGFRVVENQGPWPPDSSSLNIFLFGGSTTFGLHMDDDETIASYLQRISRTQDGRPLHVYNFGRLGYTSTQEMLLYLSLLRAGFAPRVAIFIDGLNDCQMGKDAGLPIRQTPELTVRAAVEQAQKPHYEWLDALEKMPMIEVVKAFKRKERDEHPYEPPDASKYPAIRQFVINRWRANKSEIETLSRKYNVRCVFVWQPTPVYKYEARYNFFGAPRYHRWQWAIPLVYPEIENMGERGELGDDFLDLSGIQEGSKENLYVDQGHYTAAFSQVIARDIHDFLVQKKYLDVAPNMAAVGSSSCH